LKWSFNLVKDPDCFVSCHADIIRAAALFIGPIRIRLANTALSVTDINNGLRTLRLAAEMLAH
jgi:hypothetical protein